MVFGLALVNYLFSAREVFLRMGVVMLPVSLIIALGLDELARSYKMVFIAAITLIAYGVETNFLDMAQRPDYWFDNRPLVYDFWYRSIKLVDSGGEKKVLVSSLLGSGEAYCRLYLGERCREGVIYTGFDLSKSDVKSGAIYVGFEGEFLGADDRNEFKDDWRGLVNSRGLRIVAAREIRDTVAYRYGNYIIVAVNDD